MTGLKTLAAFSAELAFPDSNEYKGKKIIQELMEVSGSSLGKGEQVALDGDKELYLKVGRACHCLHWVMMEIATVWLLLLSIDSVTGNK